MLTILTLLMIKRGIVFKALVIDSSLYMKIKEPRKKEKKKVIKEKKSKRKREYELKRENQKVVMNPPAMLDHKLDTSQAICKWKIIICIL